MVCQMRETGIIKTAGSKCKIEFRNYGHRFNEVIQQMEASGQPFFMPFRIRFAYDRVYDKNVGNRGLLKGALPEKIPLFYTLLLSALEDLSSMGDDTFTELDLKTLIQIYIGAQKVLKKVANLGAEMTSEVGHIYH